MSQQEPHYFGVPLAGSVMQRRETMISCAVYLGPAIEESLYFFENTANGSHVERAISEVANLVNGLDSFVWLCRMTPRSELRSLLIMDLRSAGSAMSREDSLHKWHRRRHRTPGFRNTRAARRPLQ